MKSFTLCVLVILSIFCKSATAQNVGLGNIIWWDMNDNGVKEIYEPATQWVEVKMYQDNNEDGIADAGFITLITMTDADGKFSFGNVPAGKYFVKADIGWSHYKTTVYGGDPDNDVMGDNNAFYQDPVNNKIKTETITLAAGTEPDGTGAINTNTNNTVGIGTWKGNGLGDYVWLDNNSNGMQDASEAGLPNITVTLKDVNGNVLETAITDANGKYSFYDPIGYYGVTDYQVEFTTPVGYVPTQSNAGNDDGDSDPINGIISSVNVPMGQWNHSFDAGFKPASILPLKFTSFSALLKNNKVELKWVTANEINVNHFIVEKSFDGKAFANAAIVFSSRNGGINSVYQFVDDFTGNNAIVYYRIRSVDFDGKNTVSEIRSIQTPTKQGDESLKIITYPNPVINEVNITIPDTWAQQKITYQVINAAGVVVKAIQANNSLLKQTIAINNLPAGLYIITANNQAKVLQQRIIKQ
jgi:hypothetical protein